MWQPGYFLVKKSVAALAWQPAGLLHHTYAHKQLAQLWGATTSAGRGRLDEVQPAHAAFGLKWYRRSLRR